MNLNPLSPNYDPAVANLIFLIAEEQQQPQLAKVHIPPPLKASNEPVSIGVAVGAVIGGVAAGGAAVAAGVTGLFAIASAVMVGISMGITAGQFLGGLISGNGGSFSQATPGTEFIQAKKSSPTFGFGAGSGSTLAVRGEPIPLVYCNYLDNPWGGVRYQGKFVSNYIENKDNVGEAYITTIISEGEIEEVNIDNLYLDTASKDDFYDFEIEVYTKLNDNQEIGSSAEDPKFHRLVSQVIYPRTYNFIGNNFVTASTQKKGKHRNNVEVKNGQEDGTIWYENAITRFARGRIYTADGLENDDYWQEFRITEISENNNKIRVARNFTNFLNGSIPNDRQLDTPSTGNPDYVEDNEKKGAIVDGRIYEVYKCYYRTSKLVNEVRFNFNVLLYKSRLDEYTEDVPEDEL